MGITRIAHRKGTLRSGYTTGACATAASLAAIEHLVGNRLEQVEILLPINQTAVFAVKHHTQEQIPATVFASAGVIKDAGDDPDCTHGAEIIATVEISQQAGIQFFAGEGVATVTLPGLELPVGEPAINPIPRLMIAQHVLPVLHRHGLVGAKVTISVPGGEQLATKTIGQRLGLIGGISILGTRGAVNPYSTSAFAASVRQSVEVAQQQGLTALYLTTGSRTERHGMRHASSAPALAFIQAGDFIGVGLRASVRSHIRTVTLVVMIGKLCKLACGTMMTHVTGRAIDFNYLSQAFDYQDAVIRSDISAARTGRHLFSIAPPAIYPRFYQQLCAMAAQHCTAYSHNRLAIYVRLIDFDGAIVSEFPKGESRCNPCNK